MDAHVLVLRRDAGGTVALREPIPDIAVITLHELLGVIAREWIIVHGHNGLDVCGHRFVPVGWAVDLEPAGLVVEHRCTCTAAPPDFDA